MHTIAKELTNTVEQSFARVGISSTDRIALAFSGGSDSLALLHLLATLRTPSSLHAFYVNHHLRSSAELAKEVERNQNHCQALQVSFTVLDLGEERVKEVAKVRKKGEEEAARTLRYEVLEAACRAQGIRYLCTAHNSDDQLETLLMRIAQGGSVRSLAGMKEVRPYRSVSLVRPLLAVSHQRLVEYLDSFDLVGSTDSTNRDPRYLRNALRHQVKGPLLSLFPHAREHALAVTRRLEYAATLLEKEVERTMREGVQENAEGFHFSARWFASLDPALAELLLYQLVTELVSGDDRIAVTTIERLKEEIVRAKASKSVQSAFTGLIFSAQDGACTLAAEALSTSYLLVLEDPYAEQVIDLGGGLSFVIQKVAGETTDTDHLSIAASSLEDPLIRCPQSGDTIALTGGTMKVAKLLSQMQIPPHLRPSVPLLVDRSGIVAVFGASSGGSDRLAQRFKAPLAHDFTNIYSSMRRNNNSET